MTETTMKKTGGRRKIPMQKIESKTKRRVAFSKRKAGLLKKAKELSTLSGSDIAVLVFSEAGKPFPFGIPNADSVFQRYLRRSGSSDSENPISADLFGGCGAFDCIDRMGLDELKLYSNYLQNLRSIVAAKASSMDCSSSDDCLCVQETSFKNCFEEPSSLDAEGAMNSPNTVLGDILNGDQGSMMDDGYQQICFEATNSPNQSPPNAVLGDGYQHISPTTVPDANDDVLLLINLDDFESPKVKVKVKVDSSDFYKWKTVESSFDYSFVGAEELGNPFCDIQWEQDTDLFASFLHDSTVI